ncbi:(4Fe-4S)-binding protein, partial [Patescibacteria group bacterium]|nr:(4Fe-4S)-binding protein [Patescibacteria group bacterium]
IIDGAPGIGCPVIASLSGINCAVVVTEPTLSGLHDAKRVIEVARHFGVAVRVIINKFDLNFVVTKKIEDFCQDNTIELLGKVSYDESVVKALVEGKTILEYSDGKAKKEITSIWQNLGKKML